MGYNFKREVSLWQIIIFSEKSLLTKGFVRGIKKVKGSFNLKLTFEETIENRSHKMKKYLKMMCNIDINCSKFLLIL